MKMIILLDLGDSGPFTGHDTINLPCMPLHEYMDSDIVGGTSLDDLYQIQLMAVGDIVLNYDGGLDVMRVN
jgi:hypothetical protein